MPKKDEWWPELPPVVTPGETQDVKVSDTEPPPDPIAFARQQYEAEKAAHEVTKKELDICIHELHNAARLLKTFGITYQHPNFKY